MSSSLLLAELQVRGLVNGDRGCGNMGEWDGLCASSCMMETSQKGTGQGDSIPHVSQPGVNIVQLHGLAGSVEGTPLFLCHEGHLILGLTIGCGFALDPCEPDTICLVGFHTRLHQYVKQSLKQEYTRR